SRLIDSGESVSALAEFSLIAGIVNLAMHRQQDQRVLASPPPSGVRNLPIMPIGHLAERSHTDIFRDHAHRAVAKAKYPSTRMIATNPTDAKRQRRVAPFETASIEARLGDDVGVAYAQLCIPSLNLSS